MTISVEDHIAIQRLMYRYAYCADKKDYAGFSEVFCEDAVFDYSGRKVTPFSCEMGKYRLYLSEYRYG